MRSRILASLTLLLLLSLSTGARAGDVGTERPESSPGPPDALHADAAASDADVVLVIGGKQYDWTEFEEQLDGRRTKNTPTPSGNRSDEDFAGEDDMEGSLPEVISPADPAFPDYEYDGVSWEDEEDDLHLGGADEIFPATAVNQDSYSSVVITHANGPVQVKCGGIRCTLRPQAPGERYLLAWDGAQVEFINVTFSGWEAPGGGAIILHNSKATFTHVAFENNTATDGFLGGAVVIINSTAVFSNCTFSQNTAREAQPTNPPSQTSQTPVTRSFVSILQTITTWNATAEVEDGSGGGLGGAVAVLGYSDVLFYGCVAKNNSAMAGGTLFQSGGSISIVEMDLSDNSAVTDGGAIYVDKAVILEVLGSHLVHNHAISGCGGALSIRQGLLSLHRSTVRDNSAGLCGGGIAMFAQSSAQVTEADVQSSFSGIGGALYMAMYSSAHISESTITGGEALYLGGAAALDEGASLVLSSTVMSRSRSNLGGGHVIMHGGAMLRAVNSTFEGGKSWAQAVQVRGVSSINGAAPHPDICGGGAILLRGGAKLWCSGCVFRGNRASGNGSAICNMDSFFSAVGSHFEGDASVDGLPSALVFSSGTAAFTTIANSSVVVDGGSGSSIVADSSNLVLDTCNFTSCNHRMIGCKPPDTSTHAVRVIETGNASLADVMYQGPTPVIGIALQSSAGNVYLQRTNLEYRPATGIGKAHPSCWAFSCLAEPETEGQCLDDRRWNNLDANWGPSVVSGTHVARSHQSACQMGTTLKVLHALAIPALNGKVDGDAVCPVNLPVNCSATELIFPESCYEGCEPVVYRIPELPALPESPTASFLLGIGIALGTVALAGVIAAIIFVGVRKKWIQWPRPRNPRNAVVSSQSTLGSESNAPSSGSSGSPRHCLSMKQSPDSDEYIPVHTNGSKVDKLRELPLVVIDRVSEAMQGEQELPRCEPMSIAQLSSQRYSLQSDPYLPLPGLSESGDAQAQTTIDMKVDFVVDIRPHLKRDNFIGAGGFGEVYRIPWKGGNVAVKVFTRGFCGPSDEQYASYLKELEMMERLQHAPQIARILGASTRRPHMALLYEYIPGGSLADRVYKGPPMPYQDILQAGYDIAVGLSHLHPRVIHRDLKPANVMIGASGMCKLIDFGLSRGKDPYVSFISTEAGGTPNYMAPEMFNGARFDEKVDIYSLGMVLYECLTRSMPWSNLTNMAQMVFQVAIQMNRPEIPEGTPRPLARLIRQCWADEPHKRPSAMEVARLLQLMIEDKIGQGGTAPGGVSRRGTSSSCTTSSDPVDPITPDRKDRTQAVLTAAAAAGPDMAEAMRNTIAEAGFSGLITSLQCRGGPEDRPVNALDGKRVSVSEVLLSSPSTTGIAP